jgi:hypothetical protein
MSQEEKPNKTKEQEEVYQWVDPSDGMELNFLASSPEDAIERLRKTGKTGDITVSLAEYIDGVVSTGVYFPSKH